MSAKKRPSPRLLVVDSDARYGEWLRHHLGVLCPDAGVSVLGLAEFERWSDMLTGRDCDVLLLTASFGSSPEDPQARGIELLRQLRTRPVFPSVIVIAEEGNELTAVRALRLGAVDYLPKRLLTPERLKTSVALALRQIEKRVARRLANLAQLADTNLADSRLTQSVAAESLAAEPPVAEPAELSEQTVEPKVNGASAGVASNSSASNASHASSRNTNSSSASSGASSRNGSSGNGSSGSASSSNASSANAGSSSAGSSNANSGSAASSMASTAAPNGAAPHDATADEDFEERAEAPGTAADFIPGYTIRTKIGESEKAAVFLARSAALGREVALKVSKTLRDEVAGRQFLEREYTAIRAIDDPSVVKIHDYGVHAGFEYLAMEYFPRGDLKARMYFGVTEQETLSYVEKIAAALSVIHHAGLLHRDLKPPNVMLRENDNIVLIDFGLARALDGSTPSTRTGVLRGSPYYMSPEQALGEQLDARSDFYSLGIIFYEMLTGKKPFTGGTAMEVLQQHVNTPPPILPLSLSQYEPLLARLLAKSRHERFSRAEEIIAAIMVARSDTLTRVAHSTAAA